MKHITKEYIHSHANLNCRKHYSGFTNEQIQLDIQRQIKIESFIDGANWMQEQMQTKWIKWGDEGSNDITQNSLVLFDNGDILRYCEEWPFAEVTHFFIVPDPPKL